MRQKGSWRLLTLYAIDVLIHRRYVQGNLYFICRLNCESDTTPNTTPEERRKRAQSEVKTAPSVNKQQSYHRSRTNSVGTYNKESLKKPEPTKFRALSISRTDTGRFSMRATKPVHVSVNSI